MAADSKSPFTIRIHPFNSAEGVTLCGELDSELNDMYPDWETLPHPGRDDKVTLQPHNFATSADEASKDADDTKLHETVTFFVAFSANSKPEAVACIALVPLHPSHLPASDSPPIPIEGLPLAPSIRAIELKRLYVVPAWRKRGVSQALVAAAEAEARKQGYGVLTLETGIRQFGALKLYERGGYRQVDTYGGYIGSGTNVGGVSICFRKDLDQSET